MDNNLIITGIIANHTGLLTGTSKVGKNFVYDDFQLRTQEETPMRPWFHLTGDMAQQFSAIQLTPDMQARVSFRIYTREYLDHTGVTRRTTDLSVTLVEILDSEGEVIHICQKQL